MSLLSTVANMFRTRSQPKTHPIILRVSQCFGETRISVELPREIAESIQPSVLVLQPDETWKSCELQSITGTQSMVHWASCPPSSCPQNPTRAPDGSQDQKPRDFYVQVGAHGTLRALSFSDFTPEVGQALRSAFAGFKST